jgi:hypothetical protein
MGEWGLKKSMPKDLKTPYLVVERQDDEDGRIKYKSGYDRVTLMERWIENFPLQTTPHKLPPSKSLINLATASQDEWKRIVNEAKSRRGEWKETVDSGRYSVSDWMQFLNVTSDTYTNIHRPTYRIAQVDEDQTKKVPARYLQKVHRGKVGDSLIGIAGFVAELQGQTSETLSRSAVTEMVVRNIKESHDGKLLIEVSPVEDTRPHRMPMQRYKTFEPRKTTVKEMMKFRV